MSCRLFWVPTQTEDQEKQSLLRKPRASEGLMQSLARQMSIRACGLRGTTERPSVKNLQKNKGRH